jgi:hypothetical protein
MSLGRSGARVASQQSPILRHGAGEYIVQESLSQELRRRSWMEDLTSRAEVEAFAGPVVDLAD